LTEQTLTNREWTDVTIVLTYVDRANVIEREIRLTREEAEKDTRDLVRQRFGDERADGYKMTNDEFQASVIRAIQTAFSTPILAKSSVRNEMRVIPPSAYRQAVVRVNNLGVVLEA